VKASRMSHGLLADSVDTSLASLLCCLVVQQMWCSVKCTIVERAQRDAVSRSAIAELLVLIAFRRFCVLSATSCENGSIYNSTCYKIHREKVNWFTAVNRCLSNNGSLAVFDDNIITYFASTLLTEGRLWIGLIKSWWTWPDAGLYSWQ